MDLFKWWLNVPYIFQDIGDWLTSPLIGFDGNPIVIGGVPFNMLAVFSIGVLSAIVIAKIVALLIPN